MSQAQRIMPDGRLEEYITEVLGLEMPARTRRKLEDMIAELHELRELVLEPARAGAQRIRTPHGPQRQRGHKVARGALASPQHLAVQVHEPGPATLAVDSPDARTSGTATPRGDGGAMRKPRSAVDQRCNSEARRDAAQLSPATEPGAPKNQSRGTTPPATPTNPARTLDPSPSRLPNGFDLVPPEQRARYERCPGIEAVSLEEFIAAPSRHHRFRFFSGLLYVSFDCVVTIRDAARNAVRYEAHPDNFLVDVLLPSRAKGNPGPISKVWWRGRVHVVSGHAVVTYERPQRWLPKAAERELLEIWRTRGAALRPVGSACESLQPQPR